MFAGQPEEALGAQQLAIGPRTVDKSEKTLGMEWPARPVCCRSDAIFFGFGHVLTSQLLQPARCLSRAFKVEKACVEDLLQRHLAHDHWNNVRLGVEPFQNRDTLQIGSASCRERVGQYV